MRKTKIVCTIGPKSLDTKILLALENAGMSIVRLNGSHSDLRWHRQAIEKIHDVLPNMPILLDIPGRKIRTIQLEHEPAFTAGDTLILTTNTSYNGRQKVPVNYSNLHADLSVGNTVMADDGTLRFTVLKIDGNDIHCRAENSGQLKSRKGINVPYVILNTPQVTIRDKEMINFACENKIDFIGLSFVDSASHVISFRDLIKGSSPRIVAKVENQGGMDHLKEIASLADAIMIDRGDLSVETSLYDVAIKQKEIIDVARRQGCPVIVATEMLHTMIQNSVPTKAEVTDISNAVLDGCSATMLSGETAIGSFAVESVDTMRQAIDAAEVHLLTRDRGDSSTPWARVPVSMSSVIPILCKSLPITKIVAVTRSGYAAKMIASHRMPQPILAVTDDALAARSFNLIAGTVGVFAPFPFSHTSADHIMKVIEMLWKRGFLNNSDQVLVTGVSYPTHGSRMNTIQIYNIADLEKSLSWTVDDTYSTKENAAS